MDLLRREQTPGFVTLHHEVIASQVRRVLRCEYPAHTCSAVISERERAYRETISISPHGREGGSRSLRSSCFRIAPGSRGTLLKLGAKVPGGPPASRVRVADDPSQ